MKELTPEELTATIGKKIAISTPDREDPIYLAIFDYLEDSGRFWGYMVNPTTKELYHRFSSKLSGATSFEIVGDLTDDERMIE